MAVEKNTPRTIRSICHQLKVSPSRASTAQLLSESIFFPFESEKTMFFTHGSHCDPALKENLPKCVFELCSIVAPERLKQTAVLVPTETWIHRQSRSAETPCKRPLPSRRKHIHTFEKCERTKVSRVVTLVLSICRDLLFYTPGSCVHARVRNAQHRRTWKPLGAPDLYLRLENEPLLQVNSNW